MNSRKHAFITQTQEVGESSTPDLHWNKHKSRINMNGENVMSTLLPNNARASTRVTF